MKTSITRMGGCATGWFKKYFGKNMVRGEISVEENGGLGGGEGDGKMAIWINFRKYMKRPWHFRKRKQMSGTM